MKGMNLQKDFSQKKQLFHPHMALKIQSLESGSLNMLLQQDLFSFLNKQETQPALIHQSDLLHRRGQS